MMGVVASIYFNPITLLIPSYFCPHLNLFHDVLISISSTMSVTTISWCVSPSASLSLLCASWLQTLNSITYSFSTRATTIYVP
jgi:hypothetical protein